MELIPFKEKGDRISCMPSADVVGCRFVSISGNLHANGLPQVAQSGLAGKALGVACWDATAAAAKPVTVISIESGEIVPITAGVANLAAGDSVGSDAAGRAVVTTGVAQGIVITGALAGAQAMVKLARHQAGGGYVAGDQAAVVHLTNNTGVAGNDVVENVPAVVAAAGEATAADLATTQAAFVAVENNLADVTDKLNVALTRLEAAGLLIP